MSRDQGIGTLILVLSIAGILIYGWLLFFVSPQVSLLVVQVTAMLGVLIILGILAWIGYTMATTPPPAPIEAEMPPVSSPASTSRESEG